jgi:TonB family protein
LSLLVSFAAHLVLLLVLVHRSRPIFVMPSDVALGTPRSSGSVIYLAAIGAEKTVAAPEKPKLTLHSYLTRIPRVSKPVLPPGVQGDVIVEVTIDEQGNVIETKLIRGIGYGIEERVLATLRQWRFRPASKDGVTIASQHIVTFHYPS